MEILRRTLSALLALVMVVTMLPVSALAEETAGDDALIIPEAAETEPVETEPETTAPEVFVEETAEILEADAPASGTCGENLTWTLVDGVLTISGTGEMPDFLTADTGNPPWYTFENEIIAVIVEEGITSIGRAAFEWLFSLEDISLPESLVSIGDFAFGDCGNVKEIIIPKNVRRIGDFAFTRMCSLQSIHVEPENTAYLSSGGVLFNKDMTTLIAYPGGKSGSYTIPDSVTEVAIWAMSECEGLTEVHVPASVATLNQQPFVASANLKKITVSSLNPSYIAQDGVLFDKSMTQLIVYPTQREGDYSIPEGVEGLGAMAFTGAEALTNIYIPSSVTDLTEDRFHMCTALENVTVSPDNTVYASQDGVLFDKSLTTLLTYPDGRQGSYTIPQGTTTIEDFAFSRCENLTEIFVPESVAYIGNCAFDYCEKLKDVYYAGSDTDWDTLMTHTGWGNDALLSAAIHYNTTVPDETVPEETEPESDVILSGTCGKKAVWSFDPATGTLTISGEGEMADYDSWGNGQPWGDVRTDITNVVIEDGITSVGMQAFHNLWNLTDLEIADSVTMIYERGFSWCESLKEIVIPDGVTYIGKYAFEGCSSLESLTIPVSVTSISYKAISICDNLKDIYYGGTQEQWEALISVYQNNIPETTVVHYNSTGSDGEISPEETEPDPAEVVHEYLNSSKIKINGSGSAAAYYLGDANQVYQLTVNGDTQKVTATNQGVIRVPLGTFQAVGTEAVTVEITHVGDEALAVPQIFQHTVQVTPLAFSQSWKGSMDASVGAKLIAGAKVPVVNLEASLGEVGGKAGVGAAMNISRSYSAGGETLTITSDKKIEAGGTVKCGITGEVLSAEFNSGASLGIGCSDTITYGLKLNNYSAANKGQQRALATYLLGEALAMNPANTLYIPFYKYLAEIVYDDSGCGVIQGSASKMSGSFGAGVSQVSINGVDIANVLNGKVEATFIQSSNAFSDGTQEKSMSGKLSASLSTVTPAKKVEGSEIGANSSLLRADFLGTDVKISAERYKEERKLESTSLSSLYTQVKFLEIGVPSTAVYNKYIFKDKALDGLLSSTSHFDDYINHNLVVLSLSDLCELADVLSESDVPIEYREEIKEKYAVSLPLEFDIGLGAGASFGITLSYLEDTGYISATGYAVNDEILLTSESDDLSSQIRKNKRELGEIFVNCIQTLAEDAANFFQSIGNAIQEGVESTWSWIEGKAESMANWIISITSAPSENDGPWKESSKVGVKGAQVNFSLARQVSNTNEAYATRSAMTIGRPFVVNVTDNATGETIGNFQEEPLEFTIRYAGEDLMAANYDAETQVISMYRYSDDGDYFEYIGGIHDAEANTVTAIITKPGQYILAAEAIEEEGCGFELGDVNHDNKINAKDATLILQKSVGVLKESAKFCEECAEVSGDGKLNAKDSTLILQFSVGLRDHFPAQEK